MPPCLPAWHSTILDAKAHSKAIGHLTVPGCPESLGGSGMTYVPCDAEKMRATVAAKLVAKGLAVPLSMTAYAVARNIMSEVGLSATPEEMVAVAECAVWNQRANPIRFPTIERQLMKDGKYFGQQRGQNPTASTSQDPWWVHIVVANLVLSGATGNFTRGACAYYDPTLQDQMRSRCVARGGGGCDPDADSVLASWTEDGYATWVGPLPGINPRHMLLFVTGVPSRQMYLAPGGKERWRMMNDWAKSAMRETGPDERVTVNDLPRCGEASTGGMVFAAVGVAGLAAAAFWAVRRLRRHPNVAI